MKQKLLMILAVLFTGGMLVACGPGDETAEDAGAGVVDEPLTQDAADPAFGETAGGGAGELGDETTVEGLEDDTTATPEAETTVEMDVGEESAATEEAAADNTEGDVDMNVEETETTTEGDTATTGDAAAEGEAEGDVAGGGAAAPAEGEAVVVTFSQAAEGVAVENIEGADDAQSIAQTGEPNPALTLSTGQRYEFVYDGEGDLVFYNSNDEEIFSTAGTDSQFANDSEVNAQMEDGRVTFTVTEDLAQELARYTAGPDEQGAAISVN